MNSEFLSTIHASGPRRKKRPHRLLLGHIPSHEKAAYAKTNTCRPLPDLRRFTTREVRAFHGPTSHLSALWSPSHRKRPYDLITYADQDSIQHSPAPEN